MPNRLIRYVCFLGLLTCGLFITNNAPANTPATIQYTDVPIDVTARIIQTWRETDGTHVLKLHEPVRIQFGDHRLTAQQAVLWLRQGTYAGKPLSLVEIFLEGNAIVVDQAGTTTRDNELMVSLASHGPFRIEADARTEEDASADPIVRRATAYREKAHERRQAPPGGTMTPVRIRRPAGKTILFSAKEEISTVDKKNGQRITTLTGGVTIIRGRLGADESILELRAARAVIFAAESQLKRAVSGKGRRPRFQQVVNAAYLEGDVVLRQGNRQIRASRIYYNFSDDQALILDAVLRAVEPQRGVPLYIRADSIRRLDERRFEAENAIITTSDFRTPHYHIGASKVELTDRTPRDPKGQPTGPDRLVYRMDNTTFNIETFPLFYWPVSTGDLRRGTTALRSVHVGNSGNFGTSIESQWHLFRLFGYEEPEGYEALLNLDYLSKRGPAAGIELDYSRNDYFGQISSYLIHDHGEDDLGRDRDDIEPSGKTRGRLHIRHRQYLPDHWEATFKLAYFCDPTFMEEFEPRRFNENRDPETSFYLKKQQDNWAFTLLGAWRLPDSMIDKKLLRLPQLTGYLGQDDLFATQTERLPEAAFHWMGAPLANWPFQFYSSSAVGNLRFRPDKRLLRVLTPTGHSWEHHVVRGWTRNELEMPIPLGPGWRLVPFASILAAAYDDSLDRSNPSRFVGTTGLRAAGRIWRVYNGVESPFWDLHRLRHVIEPEFAFVYGWSNEPPYELWPFDRDVEMIDGFRAWHVGLAQRLQTKRGGPGKWKSVDWLRLNVSATFFDNPPQFHRSELAAFMPYSSPGLVQGLFSWTRPEIARMRNHLRADAAWRISDTTQLLSDVNMDLDDHQLDRLNSGALITRSPRLSYYLGQRYMRLNEDADLDNSHLLLAMLAYRLNSKYTVSLEQQYDIAQGHVLLSRATLGYRLPRWNVAFSVDYNGSTDETAFMLTLWPEGVPELTLGSRRITPMAQPFGYGSR